MSRTIVLALLVALCAIVPAGAATEWDLAADCGAAVTPASVPAVHGQWSHGVAANLDAGWTFLQADRGDYGPGDGLARLGLQASLDGDPNMNECPLQVYNTNSSVTYGLFQPYAFYVHGGVKPDSTYADPQAHPSYNVMRWTAPDAGLYNVSALISECAGMPWGIDCQVLVNGASMLSGAFAAGDEPLALSDTFGLAAGDTIDLAIGPGAGETGQWTTVSEQITQVVPEPGSMLALGTGLIGLAGIAIRRRRA